MKVTGSEKSKVFALRPLHNWASHGADAFRTMAVIHTGLAESSVEGRSDRYRPRHSGRTWMSA